MTLFIFRGLPGSGKSTKARKMQAELGGVIAERDAIRYALFGKWHDVDEDIVTKVQTEMVNEALRRGEHVYVSDMNLRNQYVTRFIRMANEHQEPYTVIDMTDVPLSTCLTQNYGDDRVAAGKVLDEEKIVELHRRFIRGKQHPLPIMFNDLERKPFPKYVPNTLKPKAVIFDIDGTLARMVNRTPFEEHLVKHDEPVGAVVEMADAAAANENTVLFVSGRTDGCYDDTEWWLREQFTWMDYEFGGVQSFPWRLFMRQAGDNRPDDIVKNEIFETKIAPHFHVLYVVDDRNKVVRMWREKGLVCAQVAEGDF